MSSIPDLRRLALAAALIISICRNGLAESPAKNEVLPLDAYLAREEAVYGWSIDKREPMVALQRIDVTLRSQKWKGGVWKHDVRIFRPQAPKDSEHALLFVNGGSNHRKPGEDLNLLCASLASLSRMPVVAIFQVPNQPLLEDRYEDDLIAETWMNYLRSGDETWPLLFPMVKSAVAAMNAANEISVQEWNQELTKFIITGASKRGWTSWLTAAGDERIVGTAPMVIDTLNFRAQIRDQHETWGFFSEQIDDYTRRGLLSLDLETPREERLRMMMDPYSYRERLTMPKLLIHGANDRYWLVDASANYWSGLSEPKNILTIPNAGHGLEEGRASVVQTLAQFARRVSDGEKLPQIEWTHEPVAQSRQWQFNVQSDTPMDGITLWVAYSDSRDFRDSEWEPDRADTDPNDRRATFVVDVPEDQHVAFFATLRFGKAVFAFNLSTGVVQPEFGAAETQ